MELTFYEHVEEMRRRLIKVFIALIIVFFSGFWLSHFILISLSGSLQQTLIALSPLEVINVRLYLGLLLSFFIIFPYLFFHIISFIKPGIDMKYNQLVRKFNYIPIFSFILFVMGVSLGYILSMMSINVLSSMAINVNIINLWSIAKVSKFITITSLIFGTIFQMPLIMFILTKADIVSIEFFKKKRKIVILIMIILIAIITPQVDAFSLLIISLPAILVYELGILVSKVGKWKSTKQ